MAKTNPKNLSTNPKLDLALILPDRSPPPSYYALAHETIVFAAELPADVPADNDRIFGVPDPGPSSLPDAIPEVGGGETTPPASPGHIDVAPPSAGELPPSESTAPSQSKPDTPAAPSQQGTSTSSHRPKSSRTTRKPPNNKGNAPNTEREATIPTPEQINQTAMLLRRVFSLRLQVWALQGAHALDRRVQLERARQAEELLEEVKGVVGGWAALEGGWREEEREEVVLIERLVGELRGGDGGMGRRG
ncbi:hypothetical protein B0T18DRAFT_431734 [Schizothecium vesticola]|uniref:Uncharacterized protein n=1 Tax=Schizothecium vesticola TaxID=314040 RepID=A0AA40EJC1_9PEZI|nr:hypothetical protein B0T18DRAFT_431734 [Schizothecium vesticola]